jgi:WD40 repeat protein
LARSKRLPLFENGYDIQEHLMITRSLFVIDQLCWAPDGRYIAVRGYGKTVRILNAATNAATLATKRVYRGHTDSVTGLVWSPIGQQVISAHRDIAHTWNTTTDQLVSTFTSQRMNFHAIAWSPDGNRIAAVSLRKGAHTWRASIGRISHFHAGDFYSLAWSPAGDKLALGGRQHIEIWSPLTDSVELTLSCQHSAEVVALGWSPDGTRLASSGHWRGVIEIWVSYLVTISSHILVTGRPFELWHGRLMGRGSPPIVLTAPSSYGMPRLEPCLARSQAMQTQSMRSHGLLMTFILLQATKIARCASGDRIKI